MGNNQASCIAACATPPFGLGICLLCVAACDKTFKHCNWGNTLFAGTEQVHLNVDSVQNGWHNLHTVYNPEDLCNYLDGKTQEGNFCDLDFSQLDSSGFLGMIDGVATPGQFCGVIQGDYKGKTCIVNLSGAGAGSVEDKQAACGELQGKWADDKCVLGEK